MSATPVRPGSSSFTGRVVRRLSPLLVGLDADGWRCAACGVEADVLYESPALPVAPGPLPRVAASEPVALCAGCRPDPVQMAREWQSLADKGVGVRLTPAEITRAHQLNVAIDDGQCRLVRAVPVAPPPPEPQLLPGTTRSWCDRCGEDLELWLLLTPGSRLSVICSRCRRFTNFEHGVERVRPSRALRPRTAEESRWARLRGGD